MNFAGNDVREKQFLFHAVCAAVGTASFVPELAAPVQDWERVFQLARQHSVSPLLCHAIRPDVAGAIPPGALALRHTEVCRLLLRNAQLMAALGETLDLFATKKIPVLPFKGPALAFQLYGDSGLRSSVDLDFLIRAEDMLHAKDALLSRGYRTDCPREPLRLAAYLRVRNELHFTRENTVGLELHQAILPPFARLACNHDGLRARLRSLPFNGREVLFMSPEDLLLVLCAHGTKHVWGRLGWICDIARLLVRFSDEVDWRQVDALASSVGARRIVLVSVFLAHQLLAAPLPQAILECAQKDKAVVGLANRVLETKYLGRARNDGPLGEHVFFMRARERFRDRIGYCAHLMFSPTERDHAIFALPPMLRGLYYPLHALRIGAFCAKASFQRVRA